MNPFMIEPPAGIPRTITELLNNLADYLIWIAAPITVIIVLYSAFQFLTSGGNEAQVSSAKKTLLYAVIGFAVILIAKGLVLVIAGVLGGGGFDVLDPCQGVRPGQPC